MKKLLVPLLALLLLAGSALANSLMLVSGRPNSDVPYQSISNGASPIATSGTDFGDVVVDDTQTSTIRVRNVGPSILIYSISENSGHFRIPTPTVALPQNSAQNLTLEFEPLSLGEKTATVTITSNDPNKPTFTFSIRGEGVKPEVRISGGSPLEEIDDGDSSPSFADGTHFGTRDIFAGGTGKTFRLENTGNSDLLFIGGNVESGKGFSISLPGPATSIAPGNFQNFIISFDPSTIGTKTAEVSISTDDADEAIYTFDVRGTGTVTPDIALKGRSGSLPVTTIMNGSTVNNEINGTKFQDTEVNSSKSNLYQVSNEGTTTLEYEVSVSNSATFKLSGNIDSTIGIGSSPPKTFSVAFEPTTPGTHTAIVTIDSNDPDEDPYTFEIQGFATAPEVTILGDTDFSEEIDNGDDTPRVGDGTNFLNVDVADEIASRKFRIKNDGTSSLTFLGASVSPNNVGFYLGEPPGNTIIPKSEHETLTVFFNPSTDGQVTARITVVTTDGDEGMYTFDVTANGVGDPNLILFEDSPSGSDTLIPHNSLIPDFALGTRFGELELGDSGTRSFFIRNSGDGTLTYNLPESSPHFTINDLDSSLEPNLGGNSNDYFSITYEPQSRGTHSLLLQISSNDPDTPLYNFVVEGKGVDPEMDVFGGENLNLPIADGTLSTNATNGTNFGSNVVNSQGETRSFLIRNDGERDLYIVAADPDDDTHFTVTGLPSPLDPVEPNTSHVIDVTFEPQSGGKHTTFLRILSNDDDENPYDFRITGTGIDGPEISVHGNGVLIVDGDTTPDPADHTDFGTLDIGQSLQRTFTIFNNGNEDLTFPRGSGITANKGFERITMPGTIPPGGSDTFTITFSPTSAGSTTALVVILNNDEDEDAYRFDVTGIGNATDPPAFDSFSISGNSGTLTFQTIDGLTYQVRQSANLVNWSNLGAPIPGNGNIHNVNLTNIAVPGQPKMFYRIEIVAP